MEIYWQEILTVAAVVAAAAYLVRRAVLARRRKKKCADCPLHKLVEQPPVKKDRTL